MSQENRIPPAALVLGFAGLIPFAALAIGPQRFMPAETLNETWLLDYAALILAFMGGAQWGLATARPAPGAQAYIVSVLPALLGWIAVVLPEPAAIALLAASFAGLWAYDQVTVRRGQAPVWYGRLRSLLTAGVLACLAATWLRAG